MMSFCLNLERLKHRQWSWLVAILTLIFLGIGLAPTACEAQAVPTRNQSLMMTRPVVRPPEPPLQREIRQNRQELEAAKAELARKIDLQATIIFLGEERNRLQANLANLLQNASNDRRILIVMRDDNCKQFRQGIQRILDSMKGWHDYDTIKKKVKTLLSDLEGANPDPEMLKYKDVIDAIRSANPSCIQHLTSFLTDIMGKIAWIEENEIKLGKLKGGIR
jgi:hypothetical protein